MGGGFAEGDRGGGHGIVVAGECDFDLAFGGLCVVGEDGCARFDHGADECL